MSWPAPIPIVFTRASPATRFNGKGLLVTAGVNEPRHDFGPTTKAARGLLIEAAFTNLLRWSEEFDNAVWTKGNGSIAANSVAAPDGAQTMDLFTVTATGSGAQVYQDVATTASVRQAASFFFKKLDTNFACITVSDGAGNGRRWWFNLNTGAIASTAGAGTALTNVGYRIEDAGGGIYRCFVAWLHNASATIRVEAYPVVDADASIGVTAGRRGYVWGAMAGVGDDCGSYIKTTALAASRAADVASLATAGLLNPAGFTLYCEFGVPQIWQAANRWAAHLWDGTTDNRVRGGYAAGSAMTDEVRAATATSYSNAAPISLAAFTVVKHAIRVAPNDFRGCWNGQLNVADVLGDAPAGLNAIRLGARDGAPLEPLNGWLRRVRLFPRALTDAQLQAITTP